MDSSFEGRHLAIEAARRKVKHAVVYARVSGGSLIVLGGVSALVTIRNPMSAGFAISLAVVINGIIEFKTASRLAAHDAAAPGRLALNQIALGIEIAAYSAWQMIVLTPEAVQEVLARPHVADVLALIEPDVLRMLLELLPPVIRLLYVVVGAVAVIGCGAVAWYYRAREKHLTTLKAAEPGPGSPPPLR